MFKVEVKSNTVSAFANTYNKSHTTHVYCYLCMIKNNVYCARGKDTASKVLLQVAIKQRI